jgi:hypothetical protein
LKATAQLVQNICAAIGMLLNACTCGHMWAANTPNMHATVRLLFPTFMCEAEFGGKLHTFQQTLVAALK